MHLMSPYQAPLRQWTQEFAEGSNGELRAQLIHFYGEDAADSWRGHYGEALRAYAEAYGEDSDVVVARCPGQMNLMGVHIDYGGMASLRLAVRGSDTITVAGGPSGAARGSRVRLRSILDVPGETAAYEPLELDLAEVLPRENVGTREALMDYAGRICAEREARTGSILDSTWGILPQGQLIYLESYFRDRTPIRGFDGVIWSNVSPSGGMSSSSALVISSAFAVLGLHGLHPYEDIPEEDLVDGIGSSEWIRGTRGGTADHGGMILGRSGQLVSVGVFPAGSQGSAAVPEEYVALVLDSGVPRVYDDAVKEESVIAYSLGAFLVRDVLLPQLKGSPGWESLCDDFPERIGFIRDITSDNLGLDVPRICELLRRIPMCTSLREIEAMARAAGAGEAYEAMHGREVGDKFPNIDADYAIRLRRRFAYGLAEQDRVRAVLRYMREGDLSTALELARISHAGDRDVEVPDGELLELARLARAGDPRGELCFLPGGYGRMTSEYDRVVVLMNEFLQRQGPTAGSVQRFGAGWGGNIGGLVRREYIEGPWRRDLEQFLGDELGLQPDLDGCVASPGEGACLLTPST